MVVHSLYVLHQDIGSDRFRLKEKNDGKAIISVSQREMGNSLEFHILPAVGTSLAQDVRAAVHSDDLEVVLLSHDLGGRQFAKLRAESYEATIATGIGEDAGVERFAGLLIDECTDLHTLALSECQQRARVYDCTHTNIKVAKDLG